MSSLSGTQDDARSPTVEKSVEDRRQAALLAKARDGDRAAYGQIVNLYQDRIFNALLRLVGEPEEARELTQETFTRGLSKIESFRGDASPYTWLFRIAMNLGISLIRSNARHRTFSLDGSDGQKGFSDQAARLARDAGDTPDQAIERRERREMVLLALGKIDPEYRALLIMRDIEGFEYQQMADVLALPIGTLKSRLFRARMAFRDEVEPYLKTGRSV